MMREKLRKKDNTFDKKMIRFISRALIISTIIIMIVSAVAMTISISRKSMELARSDTEVYAKSIQGNFDTYYSTILSLTLDRNIQAYLRDGSPNYSAMEASKRAIDNVGNMYSNINFIYMHSMQNSDYLVTGKGIPIWQSGFRGIIEEEYADSVHMGRAGMSMIITQSLKSGQNNSVSIYCPIYSSTELERIIGRICLNIDDMSLLNLVDGEINMQEFNRSNYLVHQDGNIILTNHPDELEHRTFKIKDTNPYGGVYLDGRLLVYRKVQNWDFYLVTQVGYWEILKSSFFTNVFLFLVLGFIIFVVIRMSHQMVTEAYRPWGDVVAAMDQVTTGDMETRLSIHHVDTDMIVVTKGFNSMMVTIKELIGQIKEEQFQMSQIQLNALHSQIQPHFLYNTLDSIRWQAVANDDHEVAQMIKSVASYYRLVLNKGKDLIPISKELESLQDYLYIQKIRYQDILTYQIQADEEALREEIPKLTLQPLIENSIYHGIKQKRKGGEILISITYRENKVEILVEDDGVGMTEERIIEINQLICNYDEDFGYGIRNVNRRIQLYYGEEYGLTYKKNENGGVTARVLLPSQRRAK